jgi:hypothetical protein
MPPVKKEDVDPFVEFIRSYALTELKTDIAEVGYLFIDGLGQQAGLFLDFKGPTKVVWQAQLRKMGIEWDTKPVVVIDKNPHPGDENLLAGVIFHEFGHAALHKLNLNGAAKEPNACAIELMAMAKYLAGKTDITEAAKKFALARKKLGLYGGFEWKKAEAGTAYTAVTGQTL